jgi:hypothetical protein
MRAGLARTGEPSTLEGVAAGLVAVQHQVTLDAGMLSTSDDNFVARVDIALIDTQYSPRVGQVLVHPDGQYTLDRLVHDNGVTRQFIIVSTP